MFYFKYIKSMLKAYHLEHVNIFGEMSKRMSKRIRIDEYIDWSMTGHIYNL